MELINTIIDSGPGTGKTEYMKEQLRVCLEHGMHPSKILGFTFTNAAARNMKLRLGDFEGLQVQTIHSYCVNKSQHAIDIIHDDTLNSIIKLAIGVDEGKKNINQTNICKVMDYWRFYIFSITENASYSSYIMSVINKKNIEGFLKSEFAEDLRNSIRFCTDEILLKLTTKAINILVRIYDLGYLDFLDVVLMGYFEITQEDVEYIIVDEFQDLTYIEYRMILNISKKAKYLFLCDTNQGIYKWRNSNYNGNISHFKEHYGELEQINLNNNYRCSKAILSLANAVSGRTDIAVKDEEGFVSYVDISSKTPWYTDILDKCKRHYSSKANTDLAILVQSNKCAGELVSVLKGEKIEVFHKLRNNYYEIPYIRLFLKMAAAVQRPFSTKDLLALCTDDYFLNKYSQNLIQILKVFRQGLSAEICLNKESSLLLNGTADATYVVFDTETTGTDYDNDDIIQIGAVKLNSNLEEIDRLDIYIKTDKDLTASQPVHNISKEFLEQNGLDVTEGLQKAVDFFSGSVLVAHNTNFDKSIFENQCIRHATLDNYNIIGWIDTLDLARIYLRDLGLPNYKLGTLAEALSFVTTPNHNAMFDVEATVELLRYITAKTRASGIELLECKGEMEYIDRVLDDLYSLNITCIEDLLITCKNLNLKESPTDFIYIDNFKYIIEELCNRNFSLPSILEFFQLRNESDSKSFENNITVCTVHQAKGLEFDEVCYVQEFSSKDTDDNKNVDIVAVSRAINKFTLYNKGAKYNCRLRACMEELDSVKGFK